MEDTLKSGIAKEIIAHMNTIEEKIESLKDGISEIEDLETVDKLDIVNLKNEIDKIKLSTPQVSPDMLNKLKEMEKLSGKIGKIEKWKKIEADIDAIKSHMKNKDTGTSDEIFSSLELLNQRIKKIESDVGAKTDKRLQKIEKKLSKISICTHCGMPLRSNTKFCSHCGRKFRKK